MTFMQGWLGAVLVLHRRFLVLLLCSGDQDPEPGQAVHMVWYCSFGCGMHGRHNGGHLRHQSAVQPSARDIPR